MNLNERSLGPLSILASANLAELPESEKIRFDQEQNPAKNSNEASSFLKPHEKKSLGSIGRHR